jgi:hypothetical protein
VRRVALLATVLTAALPVLTGCGAADTSTPQGTLAALAAAVDDDDSAAVDRLICAAGRNHGDTMTRVRDGLVELDPAFADARWHAEPGPVRSQTATEATASLTVSTVGWPATRSPEVEEFLAASEAPRPLNELGEGGEIRLVVEDGRWLACGPNGIG